MLTVQKNANGTYQFANRRFRAISLLLVNFLRSRIAAHANAGDVDTWVHQTLTQDITDQLGGPTFAALADFTAKVESRHRRAQSALRIVAIPRRRGG